MDTSCIRRWSVYCQYRSLVVTQLVTSRHIEPPYIRPIRTWSRPKGWPNAPLYIPTPRRSHIYIYHIHCLKTIPISVMPNKADFLLDDISPPTPSGNIRPLIGRSIVTWSPLPPAQTQPEESGSDRLDLGDVARRPTSGITSRVAGAAWGQGSGGPRGATPHHITPDVWAQIGGKWVLFGPTGTETEYLYMGVFWEGLHMYGCVSRELTPKWVRFKRAYTHMSP